MEASRAALSALLYGLSPCRVPRFPLRSLLGRHNNSLNLAATAVRASRMSWVRPCHEQERRMHRVGVDWI